MKASLILATLALGALVTHGATLTTTHYGSFAQVEPVLQFAPPFDFEARGASETLRIATLANGTAEVELPKTPNPWQNGLPHAFRVTYDANTQRAGLIFDTVFSSSTEVTLRPETNALLITAFTSVPGGSVQLNNLQLLSGLSVYGISTSAVADDNQGFDLVLLFTDLPLTQSWALGGQVTFAWPGDLPLDNQQWFSVSPAVVPEPATGVLLLGGLLLGLRRAR